MNWIDSDGLNPIAGAIAGGSVAGPVGAIVGLGVGLVGGQLLWDDFVEPLLNEDTSEGSDGPAQGHRKKRPSTWDKHSGRRSGGSEQKDSKMKFPNKKFSGKGNKKRCK